MNYRLGFLYGVLVLLIFSALVKEQARNFRGLAKPSAVPIDFRVYYIAGTMVGTHSELYEVADGDPALKPYFVLFGVKSSSDSGTQAQHLAFPSAGPFLYPPLAALAMRPLTHFSPRLALFLWRCFSAFLTLVSVYFIVATFDLGNVWTSSVLALAGAFAFFPFVETIDLGQINALILACWAIGIYLAVHRKFTFSAFFFALGTLIKITPLLALGLFVIRRQWNWVLSYFAWLLLLLGLSVGFGGWHSHVTYVRKVLPALSCAAPITENKSLGGLIQSLAIGDVVVFDSENPKLLPLIPAACILATALGAILYVGILLFFYRWRKDQRALGAELAAIALLSLLISPIAWRHHYLLALIPLIFLWLPGTTSLRRWQLIPLAAATLVIGTPFADYAILYLHGAPRLLANGLEPLATMVLLGLGMPWVPLKPPVSGLSDSSQLGGRTQAELALRSNAEPVNPL